jgi:hypothetical protein
VKRLLFGICVICAIFGYALSDRAFLVKSAKDGVLLVTPTRPVILALAADDDGLGAKGIARGEALRCVAKDRAMPADTEGNRAHIIVLHCQDGRRLRVLGLGFDE